MSRDRTAECSFDDGPIHIFERYGRNALGALQTAREELVQRQLAPRCDGILCRRRLESDELDAPSQKRSQGRERPRDGFVNRGVDFDRVHGRNATLEGVVVHKNWETTEKVRSTYLTSAAR